MNVKLAIVSNSSLPIMTQREKMGKEKDSSYFPSMATVAKVAGAALLGAGAFCYYNNPPFYHWPLERQYCEAPLYYNTVAASIHSSGFEDLCLDSIEKALQADSVFPNVDHFFRQIEHTSPRFIEVLSKHADLQLNTVFRFVLSAIRNNETELITNYLNSITWNSDDFGDQAFDSIATDIAMFFRHNPTEEYMEGIKTFCRDPLMPDDNILLIYYSLFNPENSDSMQAFADDFESFMVDELDISIPKDYSEQQIIDEALREAMKKVKANNERQTAAEKAFPPPQITITNNK